MLRSAAQFGRRLYTAEAPSSVAKGFVELREYTLKPEGIKEFMRLTEQYVDLRKELLPFLGMWTCDTGGVLNRVLHLYAYDDFDHRDRCRRAAASSLEWQQQYLANSRKTVERQESTIFEPSAKVLEAAKVVASLQQYRPPPRKPGSPQPLYELRRFQLQPGYDGLPLLTAAYQRGIYNKVTCVKDMGELLFFGHSHVGTLNQVIELWRFNSAQACHEAREASRADPEWRATVAACSPGVQHFSTSFLHALPFSPLQ